MRSPLVFVAFLSLAAAGCSGLSSSKDKPVIYAAGDKATVGPLVYTVTDTQVAEQLGSDPNARTPQNRFFLVKVSITNSSSDVQPIPAMTLVDDAGRSFIELADGADVPNWLGVVRSVGPTQTEQGYVVFDAPTEHYRLRLNDPLDAKEIAIDVPLNFIHERLRTVDTSPGAPTELQIPK